MKHLIFRKSEKGFSLIEMIVSLGIFSIVITIAVGALLSLIASNQKLQGEQSSMTNLTFALDSMTREIRTGFGYLCAYQANLNGTVGGGIGQIFKNGNSDHGSTASTTVLDCLTPEATSTRPIRGISFVEGGDSITKGSANKRIMYYFEHGAATIKRRVDNADAQSIISSGLVVEDMKIIVTGSTTLDPGGVNNTEQPTVTIFIQAKEKDTDKRYYLETTVTQRILDL